MIFNITLISVNRLFPTLFIANAYGIVNFIAHCFACLSPFVAEINDPIPFIFFVSFVSLAIFSSFFLKTIDEMGDVDLMKPKSYEVENPLAKSDEIEFNMEDSVKKGEE